MNWSQEKSFSEDGVFIPKDEAEQYIAHLEKLFIDNVDPFAVTEDVAIEWSDLHKKYYPQNY